MKTPEIVTRSVPFEMRDVGDGLTLAGYGAVFNSPTMIQERSQTFEETIAPGAFDRSINNAERVIMQFDHGQHPFFGSLPIGRIDTLREDTHGLYVEARLNDSWMVEPVREAISNRAVTGMSFRFSVPDGGDTWDRTGEVTKRTINEVRLYELGPVTSPAYEDTSVGVRSALGLLDAAGRADLFRQFSDPAEEAAAQDLIAQMTVLAGELAAMEANAIALGDDNLDELACVVGVLSSLSYLAEEESGDMPESLSAVPRTLAQRRAARMLCNI